MKSQALEQVAQRLEANGHDPGELHALQEELDLLERPPSLWGRLTQNVRDYAARQWDAEERAAYLQPCDAVIRQLQDGSDLRCWFLLEEDVVIGPVRRSQLPSFEEAGQLLICRDRDRKWVSLAAVLQGLDG